MGYSSDKEQQRPSQATHQWMSKQQEALFGEQRLLSLIMNLCQVGDCARLPKA